VDPEGSAAVQLRRSHTLRATSSSSAAGEPTSCRPVSLMDRMSRLNEAQAEWQKKVEDKVTCYMALFFKINVTVTDSLRYFIWSIPCICKG
jgi:hypothetical protein